MADAIAILRLGNAAPGRAIRAALGESVGVLVEFVDAVTGALVTDTSSVSGVATAPSGATSPIAMTESVPGKWAGAVPMTAFGPWAITIGGALPTVTVVAGTVTCAGGTGADATATAPQAAGSAALSAEIAVAARDAAGASRDATAADAAQTALDRAQATADRTQTGLDRTAVAADRSQTGADRTAVAADRVQTGTDRLTVAADRVQVDLDKIQTGEDRTATAADRAAAYAAADTTAATVANAAIQRDTLAALTTAMAGSAEGALGVVYGLSADEGVYRKQSGALSRQGDTQRQIDARLEAQEGGALSLPDERDYAFVNTDEAGRPLYGVAKDGFLLSERLRVRGAVDLALDAGIPLIGPQEGVWSEVLLDAANRPVWGVTTDGQEYNAVAGVLVAQPSLPAVAETADAALALAEEALEASTCGPTCEEWVDVVLDAENRVVRGEKMDSTRWEARAGVLVLVSDAAAPPPDYDFDSGTGTSLMADTIGASPTVDLMIFFDGQSWAAGYGADVGRVAYSTTPTHPGYAVMFDAGARPGGAAVSSYVDLCESGTLETSSTACADVLLTRLNARFGAKPRIIFTTIERGGTSYTGVTEGTGYGLMRGSAQYAEMLRLVTAAVEISAAQGRRLIVVAHGRSHGEQDYAVGTAPWLYLRGLHQSASDMQADISAITGQTEIIRHYATQVQSCSSVAGTAPTIAQAQLDVQAANPLWRSVGPTYYTAQATGDGGHLSAESFSWVGRQYGHYLAEDLFGAYCEPLRVVEAWWQTSTTFRLRYTANVAIETTDALVTISTLGAGKGIQFIDGGTPPTITGIAVVSGAADTIEVTLSGASTGPRKRALIAALKSGSVGHVTGARSGIRSDVPIVTAGVSNPDIYAWACHQAVSL